jgi:hypothetical protein
MLMSGSLQPVMQPISTSCAKLGIDFVEASMHHLAWRDRLKAHIGGVASEEWSSREATQYDRCQLGRWLREEGRAQLGHLPVFRRLELAHAEFHYFAGAVLAKVMLREVVLAEEMLKNEFSQATRRMLVAINEIDALTH